MSQPYRARRSLTRVQCLLAYARRRQLYNAATLADSWRELSAQEFQWFVNASQLSPIAPSTAKGQLYHAANNQALKLELARYQDRFKVLYTLSPVAYVSVTPQALIAELNPSAAKLLGGEPQQFIGLPFDCFIKQGDGERWKDLLPSLREGKVGPAIEMALTRKESDPFPARLECLGITTEANGLAWLMAITDLSQPKQQFNYPSLTEMAFDIQEGIIITDAHTIIREVNPAFTRITGFSREEAIGQTPRLLSSGLHDEPFYQGIWQAIAQQGYWQGELWNKHKNGEVFVESLTISGIKDAEGKISHYVGSFLDITACKQAEQYRHDCTRHSLDQALQQKNAELEQVKNALSEIEVALKFLVEHQKSDHFKARISLEQEINTELVPFILQLKKSSKDTKQLALVHILENNLQHIVASYGKEDALSCLYQKLTPKEIQVAAMIRQGLSTKHIAVTLSTSSATINAHRQNIRKKLGLNKESANLRDYLARLIPPPPLMSILYR